MRVQPLMIMGQRLTSIFKIVPQDLREKRARIKEHLLAAVAEYRDPDIEPVFPN